VGLFLWLQWMFLFRVLGCFRPFVVASPSGLPGFSHAFLRLSFHRIFSVSEAFSWHPSVNGRELGCRCSLFFSIPLNRPIPFSLARFFFFLPSHSLPQCLFGFLPHLAMVDLSDNQTSSFSCMFVFFVSTSGHCSCAPFLTPPLPLIFRFSWS